MKKKINLSKKDKEDWKKFIEDKSRVPDKESIHQNYKNKKNFKFDLHGFTLDKANKKVREIIISCSKKDISEIILITGKGLHSKNENVYESSKFNKLRYSVPDYINSNPELATLVSSISNLSEKKGGEGVILIKLKKL